MSEITVDQLKEKMESKENFVLLDVREDYEYKEFNLGGKLLPLGSLSSEMENIGAKEAEIVVMCRSGNRSGVAQHLMQKAGYTNVHNLKGGATAWVEKYGV